MSFNSDFRNEIETALGEKRFTINPLVSIGLTESILTLGLNDDQLFRIIRSYIRQLVAQIHPDRTGREPSPEQKSFLDAFNLLDDRETFKLALTEFKNLKAEDRKESRILKQANTSLRKRISQTEEEVKKLADAKSDLQKEEALFREEKVREPLLTPVLKTEIRSLCNKIEALGYELKSARSAGRDMKLLNDAYMRFLSALSYPLLSCLDMTAPSIFEASLVIVVTMRFRDMVAMPFCGDRVQTKLFVKAARSAGIDKQGLSEIKDRLGHILKVLEFRRGRKVKKPSIFPSLGMYKLDKAVIKDVLYESGEFSEPSKDRRILGSIAGDKFILTRDVLSRSQARTLTLQEVLPVLEEFGLLVISPKRSPLGVRLKARRFLMAKLLNEAKYLQTTKLIVYVK
ncbi:MAG: hypothetical protein ABR875_03890 [Minisyncoccia bacterium]